MTMCVNSAIDTARAGGDIDILNQLTFSLEVSRAKTLAWLDNARGWMESGADSGSSLHELLRNFARDGLLSRTSPAYCPLETDGIWAYSSDNWQNAGIWGATGCLTLSMPEYHSAAVVCSLSDILETDVPRKFYLSARAARGILRRAEKRGKALPPMLHRALRQVAGESSERARAGGKIPSSPSPEPLPPFEEWYEATKDYGGTREEWERLKEASAQVARDGGKRTK